MQRMRLELPTSVPEESGEIDTSPKRGAAANLVGGYPTQLAPHLELRRVLGEGGSSVVFEAFHSRLKVPVAVKLMSVRGAMAPQARVRLLREAELYALLDDPRIPRVYDVDELPDGTPFVVMEFVPGASLEALLLSGPLSPRRAIGIAQQVLAALAYVHSRGVLHRDVKPANVILSEIDGKCQVRLVDFGIAKVSDQVDQTLTQQGTIVGTPHYMSPERLLGQETGERADLYSVGVMLYEMLSGSVPFGGPTLGEVIASVLRDDPEPLHVRAPHVTPELERIVQRAMQRSANARFASAVAMQDALREIEGVFKGEASSPRIVSPVRYSALPSLEVRAEDLRPPRQSIPQHLPFLALCAAGALAWMLWPSGAAEVRAGRAAPPSSEESPAAPQPSAEPTMALDGVVDAPPAAVLGEPAVQAGVAVPTGQAARVGASASGVADRLTGQFAQALGPQGLGEVLGRAGGELPVMPAEAAPPEGAKEAPESNPTGVLGEVAPAAAPAAAAAPAQPVARPHRARAAQEDEDAEDVYDDLPPPPLPAAVQQQPVAPTSDYVPPKSMPLQPWLDRLDKLLKEPPPPPVSAPSSPAKPPRRAGRVDLPANPY